MEISEEDVKKQVEEDFNESIRQQFTSSDNITEEEIAAYTEKMAEAKKLAKYKVQDEKKDEDGNYTVSKLNRPMCFRHCNRAPQKSARKRLHRE